MSSFITGMMLMRAIKNLWRWEIRASEPNIRRHETCLKMTVKYLSFILDIKKLENHLSYWKTTKNKIKTMFGRGLLLTAEVKKLTQLISKERENTSLAWIFIRFCQLCGIIIRSNTVQSLNNNENSFYFTRSDIVDFVVLIKCHPALGKNLRKFH